MMRTSKFLICTIILFFLIGCQKQTANVHYEGEGPLLLKGTGGFSMDTEDLGSPPWYLSSFFLPCIDSDKVKEIEILEVKYKSDDNTPPVNVTILKREYPNNDFFAVAELNGVPKYLDSTYGFDIPGKINEDIKGMKITRKCNDPLAEGSISNIIVVSEADYKGSKIDGLIVHYKVDNDKVYTVENFWAMEICGEESDPTNCFMNNE